MGESTQKGQDQGGQHDVGQGHLEEDDPAQFHQLVVTETRHRPTHDDEEDDD